MAHSFASGISSSVFRPLGLDNQSVVAAALCSIAPAADDASNVAIGPEWQAWVTLTVCLLLLLSLSLELVKAVAALFVAPLVFVLCGIITPQDWIHGFANEGTVTIALMLVLVEPVMDVPFVSKLVRLALSSGLPSTVAHDKNTTISSSPSSAHEPTAAATSPQEAPQPPNMVGATLKLCLICILTSWFLDNIPLVQLITMLVKRTCVELNIDAGTVLMPVGVSAILGGTLSVIGDSTNLITDGLMRQYRMGPMPFFEPAKTSLLPTAIAVVYMLYFGPKLLAKEGGRHGGTALLERALDTSVAVDGASDAGGGTVAAAGEAVEEQPSGFVSHLFLPTTARVVNETVDVAWQRIPKDIRGQVRTLQIIRGDDSADVFPVPNDTVLRAGDTCVVTYGDVGALRLVCLAWAAEIVTQDRRRRQRMLEPRRLLNESVTLVRRARRLSIPSDESAGREIISEINRSVGEDGRPQYVIRRRSNSALIRRPRPVLSDASSFAHNNPSLDSGALEASQTNNNNSQAAAEADEHSATPPGGGHYTEFVEVVISPACHALGRFVGSEQLQRQFQCAVVALRSAWNSKAIVGPSAIFRHRLTAGDTLLLVTTPPMIAVMAKSTEFLLVTRASDGEEAVKEHYFVVPSFLQNLPGVGTWLIGQRVSAATAHAAVLGNRATDAAPPPSSASSPPSTIVSHAPPAAVVTTIAATTENDRSSTKGAMVSHVMITTASDGTTGPIHSNHSAEQPPPPPAGTSHDAHEEPGVQRESLSSEPQIVTTSPGAFGKPHDSMGAPLTSDTEEDFVVIVPIPAWYPYLILLCFVVITVLATVGYDVIVLAGCCVVGVLVLRLRTVDQAIRALDIPILVMIGFSFSLGSALVKSGLARKIANLIVATNARGAPLLLLFSAITAFMANTVTDKASVQVLFPIIFQVCQTIGVDPLPPVMVMAIVVALPLATPYGSTINLLITGPGGYHAIDFVRFGLPLNALLVVLVPVMAATVYGWW